MIEVFQPPQVTRRQTAYRMLCHIALAFTALAVSMTGLFYCTAEDSKRNQDALYKVSSPETERWAVIVFVVFLLAVVYVSIAGIVLSCRTRRQFVWWACQNGDMYFLSTAASRPRASGSSRQRSSTLHLQDESRRILNDPQLLADVLSGKTVYSFIRVTPVTSVTRIRQRRRGAKVYFQNKKALIPKKMEKYHKLLHQLEEISEQ